jgi:hypothetical protein
VEEGQGGEVLGDPQAQATQAPVILCQCPSAQHSFNCACVIETDWGWTLATLLGGCVVPVWGSGQASTEGSEHLGSGSETMVSSCLLQSRAC